MDVENSHHVKAGFFKSALDIGYRHFDIARIYKNEDQFGEALTDVLKEGKYKRSDFFITTKAFPNAEKSLVQQLKEALADLKLDYVDLFLIHFPVLIVPKEKYT